MVRIRILALVLALGAALPALAAKRALDITLEDPAGATVRIEARDVTADELLAELGERFRFSVVRVGRADPEATISGAYSGTMAELLPWLLRNEDYLVVYRENPPGTAQEIERIVLMNSKADPSVIRAMPPIVAPPQDAGQGAQADRRTAGAAAPTEPEPSPVTRLLQNAVQPLLVDREPQPTADDSLGVGATAGRKNTLGIGARGRVVTPTVSAAPHDQAVLAETLAQTTRKAQEDIKALVESLRTVCPGGTC